jgi:hypothetical protein
MSKPRDTALLDRRFVGGGRRTSTIPPRLIIENDRGLTRVNVEES